MDCEHCKKSHKGKFGTGRFCSVSCAAKFSRAAKKEARKSNKINKRKRKVPRSKDLNFIFSILEFSKRTVAKMLKRAKLKCAICDYSLTSLDLHHIISKKFKGADTHFNLIALCPNCHREAHENKIDAFKLFDNSLDMKFKDWKEYYNVNN